MQKLHRNRVIVVGAGLGGMATSIRLAAAGYDVTVFDGRPGPGGKAFSETLGPYRFDTGPSLFTLKPVFDDLFAAAGRNLDDYLRVRKLDHICSYFWRDGTRMAAPAERSRLAGEFQRVFGEDPGAIERFLDYSARIHRITGHLFLEKSLHDWRTYLSRRFWWSLVRLPWIDALRTMDGANSSFFRNPRVRQFFDRYATYNGSDPYRTPGTLNIIPHVEYGIGAWEVVGGIYAVPRAMETLARELGVHFHYDTAVEEILCHPPRVGGNRKGGSGGTVRGVRTAGGDEVPADIVVSNVDVTVTYRDLLKDEKAPLYKRYQRLEPSSSGLVFYWGIRRSFPQLGLHNIFFSDDYPGEFDDIFRNHRSPDDPTVYINITSKTVRTGVSPDAPDAPEGRENWFVLVNAPADYGQDWDEEVRRVRSAVVRRLSRELETDLEDVIEEESVMTPPEIAAVTGSFRGSLYGIASNSRLAAFLRHPNRSRRYKGLYLVGGSAHPGGGMPLVVLGGKITADLVRRYHPNAG
jgi:phytoene desaturase